VCVGVCLFVCVQLFDSLWGQALTVTVVCGGMFFGLLFYQSFVGTGADGDWWLRFFLCPLARAGLCWRMRTRCRVLNTRMHTYICVLTCMYAYTDASD
jgi:hypothetical protein